MRYLRQQNINRRAPYDQRLYVDMTDSIVMTTTNNMLMPKGTTLERPVSPINGMMRYNTDVATGGQVEVYQSGTWRALRFKESTGITQQSLGNGDAIETYFGPLTPEPPTTVESNTTWGGQNLLVFVENVFQIFNTNYSIEQNPSGKPAGYYIKFDSAVPLGKPVTVLHGFDQ